MIRHFGCNLGSSKRNEITAPVISKLFLDIITLDPTSMLMNPYEALMIRISLMILCLIYRIEFDINQECI